MILSSTSFLLLLGHCGGHWVGQPEPASASGSRHRNPTHAQLRDLNEGAVRADNSVRRGRPGTAGARG